MHASLTTPATLALLAGMFFLSPGLDAQAIKAKDAPNAAAPPPKPFDPSFDYTNLPPTNQDLWAPLSGAAVTLEQALAAAQEAEGAPVRILTAEMKLGGSEPIWHFQLFVGEPGSTPKRVNVRVSSREPKVLKRMELRELVETDKKIWRILSQVPVAPEIAIELGKERAKGAKVEPMLTDVRARRLAFVPEEKLPVWKLELMGFEGKNDLPRRREMLVEALKPAVKQNLMLDRFVGEPLRAAEATPLADGMWIHDFLVGEGEELTLDSKVVVSYRLFLLDMRKIHDTEKGDDKKSKQPETFVVGQAPLKGMTQGMLGMRVGGKRKIAIPWELAFGAEGNELAPPKAMVVCDLVIESMVKE
jgi:FKBP-type peptidyl-prolyl cis-trans isomerase